MYSFTNSFNYTVSSSACREEVSSARSQRSSVIVILMGISVLMSIFAVIGIANIILAALGIIILAIAICLIIDVIDVIDIINLIQSPPGGKPYSINC